MNLTPEKIEEILEFKFNSDNGFDTIRNYLLLLLETLWDEKDMFSGKRPFGNSCWEFDVYKALIDGKFVSGKLDEDGYVEVIDIVKADEIILQAIRHIFKK